MIKPVLYPLIEEFEKLQDKLSNWGAGDTEPSYCFRCIIEKVCNGEPWEEPEPEEWQLFSTVTGWKNAARKLGKKASEIAKKLEKAPHKDVSDLACYMGWNL